MVISAPPLQKLRFALYTPLTACPLTMVPFRLPERLPERVPLSCRVMGPPKATEPIPTIAPVWVMPYLPCIFGKVQRNIPCDWAKPEATTPASVSVIWTLPPAMLRSLKFDGDPLFGEIASEPLQLAARL